MSWELRVYTPTGGPHVSGSQIASYTPSSPGGIVGEMRWTVRPNGDCVQMEFEAVPKLVDIPPRAIVQLRWQGTPVFYGFITQSWPNTDGRKRRYVALGARHLLAGRYYLREADSSSLVDVGYWFRIISFRRHPSIQSDVVNPRTETQKLPNTGYVVSLGRINAPLDKLLDMLARTVPAATWGVDAEGVLFLRLAPYVTAVQEWPFAEPIPIVADEVYDAVRIITPEGYIHEYGTPSQYGVYRTFVLPFGLRSLQRKIEGITFYFLSSNGGVTTYNTTNRTSWETGTPIWSYLVDENPNTGVRLDLSNSAFGHHSYSILAYPAEGRWVLTELDLDLRNTARSSGSRVLSVQGVAAGPTGGDISPPISQTDYAYLGRFALKPGLEAGGIDVYFRGRVNTSWMLWQMDFYGVPAATLDRISESLLSKGAPYLSPQRLRWAGQYVPPADIIVGPGGTLPAAQWHYQLSPTTGLITECEVGAPSQGGDEANAIRLAIRQGDENVSVTSALLAINREG
ncbi:hypothetical protein CSW30_11215 [Thermus scotoductus]|uniref:Uncharacterized protein n=1 Tax=Thermus scotoductus TaxID=37636 RepID=A0A430UM81_THESC|nr:hypothetical protein [Thermus scotoductus]RTI05569.1 hypothetical protein CSW30_11215 [Thermus scotoductus]